MLKTTLAGDLSLVEQKGSVWGVTPLADEPGPSTLEAQIQDLLPYLRRIAESTTWGTPHEWFFASCNHIGQFAVLKKHENGALRWWAATEEEYEDSLRAEALKRLLVVRQAWKGGP